MKHLTQFFVSAAVFDNLISVIILVVIAVLLLGFLGVLARRDKKRREPEKKGIQAAAGLSTQQSFALNAEEIDLSLLCAQKGVRAIMDEDERLLLKAYAAGESEAELAARYGISREDMTTQISELFARLEVNSRAELLKKLQDMYRSET